MIYLCRDREFDATRQNSTVKIEQEKNFKHKQNFLLLHLKELQRSGRLPITVA